MVKPLRFWCIFKKIGFAEYTTIESRGLSGGEKENIKSIVDGGWGSDWLYEWIFDAKEIHET